MRKNVHASRLNANGSSYKWQLDTFVFHKGVNAIRADESPPVVPMKCLNKQNEILLILVTYGIT